MMHRNIFLSADWHMAHTNVITLSKRPFSSLKDMENTIIANTNKSVLENDLLYLVGDICLGDKRYWHSILDRLVCKNILIVGRGNHDSWQKIPKERFLLISHLVHLHAYHKDFLICHFPYRASWWRFWVPSPVRKDPRRPIDRGLYLLHGHTHSTTPFCPYHPRMLNIGVDAWKYKPVNLTTIISIIQQRQKK